MAEVMSLARIFSEFYYISIYCIIEMYLYVCISRYTHICLFLKVL